ncbi:NADPH-dependent FMN reductase [Streptomyces zagrosensis]|uniref:FMN reductase n=1 Tax=Streptomyces zagrosensis TaxID=1042984 RepID=A0A7W9QEC0_9ACTN|nr:NADPH-dependent FMN reductase [Streptomyces zagrosensis]MBB5938723.1 FMN reductase [Streptomyces zagrosensis]
MTSLLAISGSPSARSRTAALTAHMVQRLAKAGFPAGHLRVRDLPATELLAGRTDGPALCQALSAMAAADGVIVATPVYKSAYSGLLKTFLDVLPQSGLAGKTVLPVMTGGTLAHALALDYTLRPVLAALGARHIVRGVFVLDRAIGPDDGVLPRVSADVEPRLEQAIEDFITALPPRCLTVPETAAVPEPGTLTVGVPCAETERR